MAIIKRKTRVRGNEPTKHFSKRQEKQVAKSLSGKVTPNSGATMFNKGDVLLEDFVIECKTKTSNSQSISIKKEWLEKTKNESYLQGKDHYALVFDFGPDSKRYAIIEENLFKDFIKE